jgi:tetratricopeptide (TPR) repeat protein
MKCSRGQLFPVLFVTLLFAPICSAEKSYLVVQVSDIHDKPLVAVKLAVKGSSESGTSDPAGRARIKLDPQSKANDWIALLILESPKGKDLVFISPWDAHAQVPPFENESVNFLPLVLAERGDRALLENGTALTAIAAQINKANSPKSKESEPEQQRQEALATTAKGFGLTPDEVDKAIRAWGERTNDPYGKGLAALFERNYPQASQELRESLKVRENQLADAEFFLGQSLYQEGKYRESAAIYRKALDLRPDDPDILNNLGLSLKEAGDYKAAEPLFQQALEMDEKKYGSNHPNITRDLNSLAELLKEKGDYRALNSAELLLRKALSIDKEISGENHTDAARDMNNLAQVLRTKGDYRNAEPLFRQALKIHTQALGPDHPIVATDINDLAELLGAEGNYAEAKILFEKAIDIHTKTMGPDHPVLGTDINNMAALFYNMRDYEKAEPLFRHALEIHEKALGSAHPLVADDLNNLGVLLKNKGNYPAAESLYRKAFAIDSNALEPGHRNVSRDLNTLVRFYLSKTIMKKRKVFTGGL